MDSFSRIVQTLSESIESRAMEDDAPYVPSIRSLAAELGTSPRTISAMNRSVRSPSTDSFA